MTRHWFWPGRPIPMTSPPHAALKSHHQDLQGNKVSDLNIADILSHEYSQLCSVPCNILQVLRSTTARTHTTGLYIGRSLTIHMFTQWVQLIDRAWDVPGTHTAEIECRPGSQACVIFVPTCSAQGPRKECMCWGRDAIKHHWIPFMV